VAVVPRGLPDLGHLGGVFWLREAEGDHDPSLAGAMLDA
jgi:hypothetical protein